jgi:hypothetical protein
VLPSVVLQGVSLGLASASLLVVSAWLQLSPLLPQVQLSVAGLGQPSQSLASVPHQLGQYPSQSLAVWLPSVVSRLQRTNLLSHGSEATVCFQRSRKSALAIRRFDGNPWPNTALQGTLRDKAAQRP